MAESITYREEQIGGCVTVITAEVEGKLFAEKTDRRNAKGDYG